MQDSLGGNAKTLMFVNISPADYNQDETVTALTYATRVKLITNTAEKQQVRATISKAGRSFQTIYSSIRWGTFFGRGPFRSVPLFTAAY